MMVELVSKVEELGVKMIFMQSSSLQLKKICVSVYYTSHSSMTYFEIFNNFFFFNSETII